MQKANLEEDDDEEEDDEKNAECFGDDDLDNFDSMNNRLLTGKIDKKENN